MIVKVKEGESFEFQGQYWRSGMTLKMGTRDFVEHEDKVEVTDKFTKVVTPEKPTINYKRKVKK